jgi:predicted O-methyltransferase YrrM
MTFENFYEKFGRSFRTKHLSVLPSNLFARLKWAGRYVVGSSRDEFINKRFYAPPAKSGLPKEFIRLEPWEGEYLFLLASGSRQGIVEIGRLMGGSTFLLACANSRVPINSIDIQPQNDAQLNLYLRQHGCGQNVNLIVGDSQQTDYPDIAPFDLLFIDGDHSYQGCMRDLENWYPKLAPGGHLILHDCYFGCEVQDAVVDFIARHDVQIVRSPYVISSHWQTSYGSIAHFIKREAAASRAA